MEKTDYTTLLIQCDDAKGLIHKITDIIFSNDLNIVLNREFVENESHHFFMRTIIEGKVNEQHLLEQLREILPVDADIRLNSNRKKKVVIMATKEHHVLSDLLVRNEFNSSNAEILAVISNHDALRPFVEKFDLPYHYLSHEGLNRSDHEEMILKCLSGYEMDYILLAKYMRILTPDFIRTYQNKLINIHHSFLPAFIGAKPYQQAYDRGVKIIGATAHYVTDDLDEGPIIAQKTISVDHRFNAAEMAKAGREVESQVMAQAADLLFQDMVFVHGNKTVILD